MKSLNIQATLETPKVYFDINSDKLEINGRSLPENAPKFFSPLIEWIENYLGTNPELLELDLKLEYFNTASSRQIIEIITILTENQNDVKTQINWFYRDFDEDMLHIGKEYSNLIDTEFNFFEY